MSKITCVCGKEFYDPCCFTDHFIMDCKREVSKEVLPKFSDLSKKLADFYQVDDYHKLAEAQSNHIQRLQEKLSKHEKPVDFQPKPNRA